MRPLAKALITMPDPWTGWMWLRHQHNQDLLAALATGSIPLTHEALHQVPNWRTAAYLRDLLMTSGVLPTLDKQLLHFESLLARRRNDLDGDPHERILHTFTTWHLLPKLRARAEQRPLTSASVTYNTGQITQAHAFLNWLDARGRNLRTCLQTDLDAWHAEHREHERRSLRGFLNWAMSTGAMPRLGLPKQQLIRTAPMSQHARLALIRRAATSTDPPLEVRIAALLMLLYAQPVRRLTRLTLDDVLKHDG